MAALLDHFDLLGVVRGTLEPDDPVAALARERGVPLHQARSRRQVEELVLSLRPKATVISSYNRLLGPAVLEACPVFNVHYAPLPRYRGNAPVNWALLNGEQETAITVHRVITGLDDGPILFQEKVPIRPEDSATSLLERLNAIQRRELGTAIERGLSGWPGIPQDNSEATYGCPRNPEDGEIDWRRPAAEIDSLTRALTAPFPGAFTHHQGTTLVVHRAGKAESERRYVGAIPGRVIDLSPDDGWIDVLTGGGVLRVHEMSRSGEPPRPATHFVSSRRARLGLTRNDLLQRITELEKRLARLEARRTTSSGGSASHG